MRRCQPAWRWVDLDQIPAARFASRPRCVAVVGVKPTYGAVSRYGLIAFASSLDQIGPFAHTVEDAAMLLDAVSGHDPMDATSYPGVVPSSTSWLDRGLDGVRVGVAREFGGAEGVEADVTEAFESMVAKMEAGGAEIVDVTMPSTAYALSAYYLIAPAECSANLARFDGVRYGLRVNGETTEQMMSSSRGGGLWPRGHPASAPWHICPLGRLLRRVLRAGTEGANVGPR